eukprot:COSAG02_NODE_2987_length_7613_cov_13.554565_1_plen_1662_part_00
MSEAVPSKPRESTRPSLTVQVPDRGGQPGHAAMVRGWSRPGGTPPSKGVDVVAALADGDSFDGAGGEGDADEADAAGMLSPALEALRAHVRQQIPKMTVSRAFADAKSHHLLFSKDRLRPLRNPMREYKAQYVVNMWKVYNHHFMAHRSAAKILNLLFYAVYVYMITYLLAHLPPPAVMQRHQEAVSDLLLGEEFDAETTHIFKNFDDIMTAEEMWQWAEGPLSAGLLVDDEADGNLAALLGTNWLLGPVRLRQERSREERTNCKQKLSSSFGPDMGEQLTDRGVRCTSDWFEHNATDFLNLSKPLETLNGSSFIDAFPEWYNDHAVANIASSQVDGFFCCSQSGCFKNPEDQKQAIENDPGSKFEWACPVNLQTHTLLANPPNAYRSSVKSDPTETSSLWAKFRSFGAGGFHIDLPGNSSTFVRQLKALRELQFVDQYTRSLTFQFIILNGNTFSAGREGLFSSTMGSNYDPTVIVAVDVNFVFSPSGHVKSYSRITSMQLRPLHFLGIGLSETEGSGSSGWIWTYAIIVLPVWMIMQEIQKLNTVGFWQWIRSGWNVFEFVYIYVVFVFCDKIRAFMEEEDRFLLHYQVNTTNEDYDLGIFSSEIPSEVDLRINTQYLFNDGLPLRGTYTMMIKVLGIVCLVVVFKFFKYMRIFRSTSLLWDTLRLAAGQLLAYTAVMFWVIFAFALCTTLLWGRHSKGFQNIPSSMFQLVRLAAGVDDIEYNELKRGDASMTPGIFLLFVGLVAILGMNLMIAIVTDFYEEARDTLRKYEVDYTWIQNTFSGNDKYEDFYRGKGLWNEPAKENATGAIGEALQALRGTWTVKPVPVGYGPRKWDAETKEVLALGETQSYPFILHRSSRVQIRYRVESHEHGVVASTNDTQTADPSPRTSSVSHLISSRSREHIRSQAKVSEGAQDTTLGALKKTVTTAVVSTTSSALKAMEQVARSASTPDQRIFTGFAADPQSINEDSPHADIPREHEAPTLDLWMAASSLAQFRGIRYLEQLKGTDEVDTQGQDSRQGDVVPGDKIILKTPAEGGMMGEIVLKFVRFKPVRRASREDKQQMSREIEMVREELHDLHTEFERKRQSVIHSAIDEQVQRLHSSINGAVGKGDVDHTWTPLCPGCSRTSCEPCKTKREYAEKIAQVEGKLQRLHKQRGELEGVERIMIFDVVDVDSWQKFRPLAANQGHLGERLKEACVECVKRTAISGSLDEADDAGYKDNPDTHVIHKDAVIRVVAEVVLAGLERQYSQLGQREKEEQRHIIEEDINTIIMEMADEEENIKTCNQEAKDAIEEQASKQCVKCGSSKHTKQAVKTHETMMYLRDHDKVALDLLVPNYDVAHPNVSAAMNRLMKKAQRIKLCHDHTPLLEVQESAEFELKIPPEVQRRIVWRSISRLCSSTYLKSFLRWIFPIHFITRHMYFHSSVEDDVEDFLEAKCIKAQARMPTAFKRSLKLQMGEFMGEQHSICLADFSYQLQYFVFKVKSERPVARLRSWFHRTFKQTFLRSYFIGLRIPMRRHYSQVEEEIAMNYLLISYNDFIDRRRGSILGDPYSASGVLLDPLTRASLDKALEQSRREEEEDAAQDELNAKLAEVGALLELMQRQQPPPQAPPPLPRRIHAGADAKEGTAAVQRNAATTRKDRTPPRHRSVDGAQPEPQP